MQADSRGTSPDQPYAWTGREYDPETGFYFLRARYYDPRLGRFTQEDPIGEAGGANLYAYVDGQPMEARDPSGLTTEYVAPQVWCSATSGRCASWDGEMIGMDGFTSERRSFLGVRMSVFLAYADYIARWAARLNELDGNVPTLGQVIIDNTRALKKGEFDGLVADLAWMSELTGKDLIGHYAGELLSSGRLVTARGSQAQAALDFAAGVGNTWEAITDNLGGTGLVVLGERFWRVTDPAARVFVLQHEWGHVQDLGGVQECEHVYSTRANQLLGTSFVDKRC